MAVCLTGCKSGDRSKRESGPADQVGQADQPADESSPAPAPDTSDTPLQIPPIELARLDSRGLDDIEQKLVELVDSAAASAESTLRAVVDINSGSMNHDGVHKVGDIFAERLRAIGFKTQWIDQREVGRAGHLIAEIDGGQGKRVLLIGHLDTVFEKDSPFQRMEALAGENNVGKVTGPGVADMKGGDVIILSALEALHALGVLAERRVVVVLTGDEEFTGKPLSVSRAHLIEQARRSDVALGFEGGTDAPNTVVIARRGFTDWSLRATGKRGHSSLVFSDEFGAGAAYETARILSRFYKELRAEPYLTFNVGTMLAGTAVEYDALASRGSAFGKTNVVAQDAHVAGDLRTISEAQRTRIEARMRAIVAEHLPETSAEIVFTDSYPPMSPSQANRDLAAKLDLVSRDLGLGRVTVIDPSVRGAADVSFVAPHVACLDGLGMVGGNTHSPREFADLTTLPAVIKRTAVLLYRLTREPGGSRN